MVKAGFLFTAETAAEWGGCELTGSMSAAVTGVEVDSRRCVSGSLFVALVGERVDGHDYISVAVENGAGGVVVSQKWAGRDDSRRFIESLAGRVFFLLADDPLRALQKMASSYMKGITRPVRIGVTGSNGKTTTKELIASVLSEKFSVAKTEGNYNSEIGLPLTVFNIKNEHDYAVIEMGINRLGEMDVLSEILRPDLVVITNIGTAHIGIFKDKDTIALEKRRAVSLFDGAGTLFVDEDEPYRDFLADGLKGEIIVYGQKSLENSSGGLVCSPKALRGWEIALPEISINFPLVGRHNLKNAFCAFSMGRFAGLTDEEIKSGLEKAEPLFGRSEIIDGPVTIIQDCYNANIDSLTESIDFADQLEWQGRKLYVLGDMKELGSESREMHRTLGRAAASSDADAIFFFGQDSVVACEEARNAGREESGSMELFCVEDYQKLEAEVVGHVEAGDLLLLKGSRSMNLERLVEPVRNKFGGPKC